MKNGDKWNWAFVLVALMLAVYSITIGCVGVFHEIPFGEWFTSGSGRTTRKFLNFFAFMGGPMNVFIVSIVPLIIYGVKLKAWASLPSLGLAILIYIPAYIAHIFFASNLLRIPVFNSLLLSWATLIPFPLLLLTLGFLKYPKEKKDNANMRLQRDAKAPRP